MSDRNPVLSTFTFTDHDLWKKYHSDDVDAFLESKSIKDLFKMCKDRGLVDSEVLACGHRTHKKTYITALREAYLMTKVTELIKYASGNRQPGHVSQETHKDVLDELSTGKRQLIEVSSTNSKLRKTNRVLHNRLCKKEKEIENLKLKLQEVVRSSSPVRVIKQDTPETIELLRVANRDIEAFGAKMVQYCRRIMASEKAESELRECLQEKSQKMLSLKESTRHAIDCYDQLLKKHVRLENILGEIAAASMKAVPGTKRRRT
jgi:hypothetical protein